MEKVFLCFFTDLREPARQWGAQVIANVLNLELYKVDMAGVLSKYVGESEKKLGNIFEQAKKSQSILFFDEADVLFGKRDGSERF